MDYYFLPKHMTISYKSKALPERQALHATAEPRLNKASE